MTGTAQIDRTALLQKVTISSLLTIMERGKVVFDGSTFNVSDSDHSHNAYTQFIGYTGDPEHKKGERSKEGFSI